ncbi:hypothetical protein V6N11_069285 [Hibiscus sabdariffa]|uniref:Uncharacterized protein n=2 Tax=Hibiscus sabdariffa TaxID=183260 RepID=A0ABR2ER35_9ROSI
MPSSTSSSAKPSVPGKPLATLESNQLTVVSAASGLDSPKGTKKLHLEEWYYHAIADAIDKAGPVVVCLLLPLLSAVELSRHAVELEKKITSALTGER